MQRLKTRPQFQAALAGQTVARTRHFALHCCSLAVTTAKVATVSAELLFPHDGVWMGAMVPKRWAKRAVTRNAIKRQIYTVSAEIETSLTRYAHVVRLRASFDRSQYVSASSEALKNAVRVELQELFALAVSP